MSLGIKTHKIRRLAGSQRTMIDGHTLNYRKGNDWYVDASRSSTGLGSSWEDAFLTMAEAFAVIGSGDTIYFTGKVREQLVTPVQVFDVRVVGMGNRPRHADSAPVGGNTHAATWAAPASPTAAQALVRVLQQGWIFENILFAGSAGCASVELVRNAASGDSERDASHALLVGCKFFGVASTDSGVKFGSASFTEIVNNARIEDCDFFNCANAIKEHSALTKYAQIVGNRFQENTNDIVLAASHARILNNVMSLAPTAAIVISGGTGSSQVHGNYLPGTYANGTLYAPGTSDNWNGNYASTGVTAAVPA